MAFIGYKKAMLIGRIVIFENIIITPSTPVSIVSFLVASSVFPSLARPELKEKSKYKK